MRWRDHIALTLPSFLLRLTLALIFLWAGASKILGTTTTDGDDAARLANLGVKFIADSQDVPSVDPRPAQPVRTLPEVNEPGASTDPITEPDSAVDPDPSTGIKPEPKNTPKTPATQPQSEPKNQTDTDPEAQIDTETDPSAQYAPQNPIAMRNIAQTVAPAVGSDFPEPVTYKRVYGIALLMDHAAQPSLTPDSQPVTPTMPSWMGSGRTPVYAAWAAAITELTCGVFLLFGILTRISALSLCMVMLVAMWSTQIGPAVLQSNDAILGFIPNRADVWDPASYTTLLWQFAVFIMCLSVALLGAGPLSVDRLLFRPSRRDPYVSGESRPQGASKSKPEPQKDRSAFDRSPPPKSDPTP